MRIERFARDEQPHDFARTLKNRIHTAIAQKSFHCDRRFTPPGQRVRSFIAATTAHLHSVIGNFPGRFRRPHFTHGCFDAQIASFTIEQRRTEKCHRFHGKNITGHFRYFAGDSGMLPDGHAPLNAFAGPFARNLEQPFGNADACSGKRKPASIQRRERDFEAFAFARDDIFARHTDIFKINDRVVERAQSHEAAAVSDLQPRRLHIDNECRNLFAIFAANQFRRRPRHDHKHPRFHAVGTPKFLAIQNELRAIRCWLGTQAHRRRIGAGVRFGQRKSGNFSARNARQVFLLLLFRAKQEQWLGHSD